MPKILTNSQAEKVDVTPPAETDSRRHLDEQIPNTPVDLALLLTELRRLIVAWRERSVATTERDARIYRQVESDLSAVISRHTEVRSIWAAARHDLVRALLEAMDERAQAGR